MSASAADDDADDDTAHRPFWWRFHPVLLLLAAMWAVRIADMVIPGQFSRTLGLRAWHLEGLVGVFTSPFLHASWGHLLSNTIPFLVLGALVCWEGGRRFWAASLIIAVVSGAGTWLISIPGSVTVGASGLIFGYFGYLIARSVFAPWSAHRVLWVLISLGVGIVYAGMILRGMLPFRFGISWQAHLTGLLGGVVAAWALYRGAPEKTRQPETPGIGR